jgi:hypothetical protein
MKILPETLFRKPVPAIKFGSYEPPVIYRNNCSKSPLNYIPQAAYDMYVHFGGFSCIQCGLDIEKLDQWQKGSAGQKF